MNDKIDWDDIAEEADRSPAVLLAEALAKAEGIRHIVIIFREEDWTQWTYKSVAGDIAISMIELAKFNMLLEAKREVGEL